MSGDSQAGMAAPQAAQSGGAYDPANPLPYFRDNPYFTYSYQPGVDAHKGIDGPGDNFDWVDIPARGPQVLSSNGRLLGLSPDNTFVDSFDKPGGQGEREKVDVTYKYDPATGKAEPISASDRFQSSDWADTWMPVLQTLAPVVTAGLGGAYGAGAFGGAEGAAAGNGAFLGEGVASGVPAWDAAYTGAGGVLSGGSGGLQDFGNSYNMDYTPDAPTSGVDAAHTGSDAHFYQDTGTGTGLQDLANMGGAGTATTPTVNLGGTGFLDSLGKGDFGGALSSAGGNILDFASTPKGLQTLISLGTGLATGIGGGSGGSGSGSGAGSGGPGRPVNNSPNGFWSQLDAGKRPQPAYANYPSQSMPALNARAGVGGK